MKTKICVFCESPFSNKGAGEHVYPLWWNKMWQENGDGPFSAQVGDEYLLRRAKDGGGRRELDELQPVKLYEVCGSWEGSKNCNGKLGTIFEDAGRPAVEAVWRRQAVLSGKEVFAFAAWWVKTLLLASHPLTEHTFPGLEAKRQERDKRYGREEQPFPAEPGSNRPLLPLLRSPELFPPDLSLWLAVGDETDGQHALEEHRPILLPTIHYGTRPAGSGMPIGAGPTLLTSPLRVLLELVHHPRATVAHPFERAGLAVRLWPDPPDRLDITALPVLNSTGIHQFERQFIRANGAEIVRDEAEGPVLLHACPGPALRFPGRTAGAQGRALVRRAGTRPCPPYFCYSAAVRCAGMVRSYWRSSSSLNRSSGWSASWSQAPACTMRPWSTTATRSTELAGAGTPPGHPIPAVRRASQGSPSHPRRNQDGPAQFHSNG
ncbi:hypothetical protein ACFVVU_26810 [Kitasatospora sp. NPDC057965]|uniref:hypothetical protein n=1 Tax=Kitasatospora sp. NPDC057965 TaxID=3346291 RepID=UPI0036DD4023